MSRHNQPLALYMVLVLGLLLPSCSKEPKEERIILGLTMGTYYRVTLADVTPDMVSYADIMIREVLERINQSMSVYDPESEISRFNRIPPGEMLCVSPEFAQVMRVSFKVHEITGGAFDPSLGSVIDLWGFGTEYPPMNIPGRSEIEAALQGAGLDKISMDEHGCLTRQHPGARLNLSGVAKGYGVDAIARALKDMNISSFLVDIGGDIYAGNERPDGSSWKVGISAPFPYAETDDLAAILELSSQAVATSGDYRNFFMRDGKKYSHIIDPSTGHPVRRQTVSATVKAETCALADALSTAMMVMDPDKALALAGQSDLFDVLLISTSHNGETLFHASPGF